MSDPRELIERAARGDEAAWREIVERYQRLVLATIRGFRLSREDAEDAFQETFLRFHRHLPSLRNPDGVARWLVQTTRRLCLDHVGRLQSRPTTPLAEELPDDAPAEDERFEALERAQAVREALARLSPRCRDLLQLLYLEPEPRSYREIADRLGMPPGSIGPTRARCLETLLRRLGPRFGRGRGGGRA